MKKALIISVVVLITAGVSIGLYLFNMKAKNYAESKPSVIISAEELFNQFVQDETKAGTDYVTSNAVVQVNGILKEVVIAPDSTTTLLLAKSTDGETLVKITLEKKQPELATQLKPGDALKVNGQCTGIMDDFITKSVQMIRGGVIK